MKNQQKNKIILYKNKKDISIDVHLEKNTVWLSQKQMGELFNKDIRTINEHIQNTYKEKELEKISTIRKFRIVRKEGNRSVERKIDFYNLDVIISVGYRVKSKRGTQFRIWATKIIKDHLVKGYTSNQKRLKELQQTIKLLKNVVDSKALETDEATGLLRVITDYSYALEVLDEYDHQKLKIRRISKKEISQISYEDARNAIGALKEKFGGSELFGNEKDASFKSSLATVYQSFDGKDLYSSIEEKAAHLLYFVIKNHSFSDGNKRIAAFLFIWFLEKNTLLYAKDGSKRIADNALVALTLMIAESRPKEKEVMTKVIVNLINKSN